MNEEETKKIIDNMSEQELNDFIFFALQEVEKENQKLKTEIENKDKEILKLKNNNKDLLRKLRNRVKEVKKLTKYSSYKKEFSTLNKQLQRKDKIIDEIQEEVRGHIGFENRLKRDNREPDLINQGRFYVANNINNILKGK